MKIRLTKDSRMYGRTGDVVEASPELAEFLQSVGMAEPAPDARELTAGTPRKPKKTAKRKE